PILPSDEKCPHCGAIPLRRRVAFGAKREEFTLTGEEEPFELGEIAEAEDWRSPVEQKSEAEGTVTKPASSLIPEIRWGGFFRRACAFLLDGIVILALSAIMFYMCYVGYKVGLSAHGRTLTWERSTPFFVLFTWAWIGLATAYFVIFHGIEGKTIGKWLLGLRVVGAEQSPVTYRRGFFWCVGRVCFVTLPVGVLRAL